MSCVNWKEIFLSKLAGTKIHALQFIDINRMFSSLFISFLEFHTDCLQRIDDIIQFRKKMADLFCSIENLTDRIDMFKRGVRWKTQVAR